MAAAMVSASLWVVDKALASLADNLLKDWAASVNLGPNVDALELELLSVQAILEANFNREIDNSALNKLLVRLQDLGYDADDMLDELEYFRIQDVLDGTFDAADKHAKGYAHSLVLHGNHTANTARKLICQPTSFSAAASRACCSTIHALSKCFPYFPLPSAVDDDDSYDNGNMHNSPERNHTNEAPKLSFDRVAASKRMQDIIQQLRLVRETISGIVTTLGSCWRTVPNIAQSRPITTSESIEPRLYGRDLVTSSIIHDITKGRYFAELLTVIPVVGPGGIGKTTLAQHIYHNGQVQEHFDVMVWICVSLNFNAKKLTEDIEKYIPKVDRESKYGTTSELIGQRLQNKRLLLVLDDIWDCSDEDEWRRLLVPFQRSQVQGNVIIVTTRFPAQAQIVKTVDHPVYLQGLDPTEFYELFIHIVFGSDQSLKDHKFLLETGDKIVTRLNGSPLAAKTVGRLLKTQLDLIHWTRVLESKEWEKSNKKNDIMPALKLSYDYLPSHLQRCFSYCSLFPQDYKFKREELIHLWIGLDVLHRSHGEHKKVEDIGLSHLTQLVNHGFFEKEIRKDGSSCYIIHDLLHELVQKVSPHECLSIDSSQFQVSSLHVLPTIRHLSINIDDISIKDRLSFKNCVEDFSTLDKRLKVEKLRSLMLFGEHQICFLKAFGDLFREAKALRVVFLSEASYSVEDLLYNFYNLVHLRYLHIHSARGGRTRFPNKLSRFYHVKVLDAEGFCDIVDLPRNMSNLVNLRHFLVQDDNIHSSIVDVGKLKLLQELQRFIVGQEVRGFELRQIGYLLELCGSLQIDGLENVQANREAEEAKLFQKSCLDELILCWNTNQSTNDSTLEEHVLESLKPNRNLLKLTIKGHRGVTCPSWLGLNLSIKRLESLCLDGVAWKIFPPIGELWHVNDPGEEIVSNIPDKRFGNLRRLELVKLPWLKKWVVDAPCQLFPFLEVLIIQDCPQLVELSFSHSAGCCQQKEAQVNLFPRLSQLLILHCPQLSLFPPIPWTKAPCSAKLERIGRSGFYSLGYRETTIMDIS